MVNNVLECHVIFGEPFQWKRYAGRDYRERDFRTFLIRFLRNFSSPLDRAIVRNFSGFTIQRRSTCSSMPFTSKSTVLTAFRFLSQMNTNRPNRIGETHVSQDVSKVIIPMLSPPVCCPTDCFNSCSSRNSTFALISLANDAWNSGEAILAFISALTSALNASFSTPSQPGRTIRARAIPT